MLYAQHTVQRLVELIERTQRGAIEERSRMLPRETETGTSSEVATTPVVAAEAVEEVEGAVGRPWWPRRRRRRRWRLWAPVNIGTGTLRASHIAVSRHPSARYYNPNRPPALPHLLRKA